MMHQVQLAMNLTFDCVLLDAKYTSPFSPYVIFLSVDYISLESFLVPTPFDL
jgi:hypothetical protein